VIPNLITLARLPLAALFAVLVAVASRGEGGLTAAWGAVLAGVVVLEELTDALDGMAARRLGQSSRLGGILDPLADSLGRLTVYFAMALAGWVTIAVPLVMAGRDIVVAYTRIVQGLTGGKTSARLSGKVKAVVQCGGIFVLIGLAAAGPWVGAEWVLRLRRVAGAVVAGATLWSLADYVRGALPGIRTLARSGGS
jgi:CDP-diacylglycerol--glycerol-3-phosphate 3-phosphatidyltransferase